MRIQIESLSTEAFEQFGTIITASADSPRVYFPATLSNLRPHAELTLSTAHYQPEKLPITANVMERHRYSAQVFLPLDVERFFVLVAPHLPVGGPDMERARGFIVPGNLGISYRPDTWHHPSIVLDRPGVFTVLLWRDGTSNDIDTVPLRNPVEVSQQHDARYEKCKYQTSG
jgi:ureidoglycolate lyase